ncbi:hypothetical protein [Natronocalculus amylovorans]|uniref:VWA domain-containing protein n=1 Tax=Natronocalculus amylovorans TaxID=2917812 RepID=A0AAE3FZK2_9EURY|nr:hypothetical protein [Natronocalculus amylovorans]MCL9818333.1 hypothetical protein [Natronocalculus amylovorans]
MIDDRSRLLFEWLDGAIVDQNNDSEQSQDDQSDPKQEDESTDDDLGLELLLADAGDRSNDDEEIDESELNDSGVGGWEDSDRHVDVPWNDSLDERDDRIDNYRGDAPHRDVRLYLRESGLIDDIKSELNSIGQGEEDMTDEDGSVLDMRNVTRLLAGDTTVKDYYRRRNPTPRGDLAVGISIDMSGSMSSCELDAKAAVGGFLFAVQENGGAVVANAWRGSSSQTEIELLTGPHEPFRWSHLDATEPGGQDPIARGMFECGQMLAQTRPREKLLLVITDGKPNVQSRTQGVYDSVIDEAQATVDELRSMGLMVVGLGFGNARESNLVSIFGREFTYIVSLEDLAVEFVQCYEEHNQPNLLTA